MNAKKAKLLVFGTIAATIIYLIWRIFYTLPFGHGAWAMGFGIVLLIAEITGLFEQIVHYYGMSEKKIPNKPKQVSGEYPSVDVFIATYNESTELLYKTVNGCVNMEYPTKEKLHIYLCDDGNREEVKRLAEQFQIGYLTRNDHEGAKAGNLNNALAHTSGELIVTLDADMIPMSDFLMASVPYFMNEEEEKLGFVQMPQCFYNLDLFQYNLYAEENIPNEQDYFYMDIQLAKNKSNSVIYGGSNTVISRAALEEIGGFVTNVITEDFATGMLIQSKGYRCIAVDDVHASGLSPEDLDSLVKQRKRWARGCIQTGRKLNIFFKRGLTLGQKINYINSISYWYSPMKRLIYMVSPILYAVFHTTVLVTTPLQLLFFWLPMYYLNTKTLKWVSGNIRTVRWTNIYETIMFPLLLKDVMLEILGISEKHFSVTKKGSTEEKKTRHVRYAIPHITFLTLTVIGIAKCVNIIFTTENVSILFLVFWLVHNFYNLVMAIFFMLGRPEMRKHVRFRIEAEAVIEYEKSTFRVNTIDISEGGCLVKADKPYYIPPEENAKITIRTEQYETTFFAKIVKVKGVEDGYLYAFQLTTIEEEQYKALLLVLHDRVPPLTKSIQKEYGFFEDFRTNIMRRQKRKEDFSRKLPRVKMKRQMKTSEGDNVTLLSFNYEFIAVKHKKTMRNPQKFSVPINERITIKLLHIKELSYYKLSESEKVTQVVSLYRIMNLEEIIQLDGIADDLMQIRKESLKMKINEKRSNQPQSEYDELTLI